MTYEDKNVGRRKCCAFAATLFTFPDNEGYGRYDDIYPQTAHTERQIARAGNETLYSYLMFTPLPNDAKHFPEFK